jgi:hypothetical protein
MTEERASTIGSFCSHDQYSDGCYKGHALLPSPAGAAKLRSTVNLSCREIVLVLAGAVLTPG